MLVIGIGDKNWNAGGGLARTCMPLSESEMGFWVWLILFASLYAKSRWTKSDPPRAFDACSCDWPRSADCDIGRLARESDFPFD